MSTSRTRLGLHPEWVEELLVEWAGSDERDDRKPGYDSVSPMFRLLGVPGSDSESDELRAVRRAMAALHVQHESLWTAVMQSFKPWSLGPPTDPHHMVVLHEAGAVLALLIDKEMGE